MTEFIDILLLLFLVITSLAAIRMRDLLSATIILGAYSLVMALVWMRLNAVDVAFTEASVGAGITAVLMVAALSRTKRSEADEDRKKRKQRGAGLRKFIMVCVVVLTALMLMYGTLDLPDFGDPNAPAHTHVAKRYIDESYKELHLDNFVTAVLASYRGYDTLGETTVIFTAGISVILLLRRKRKKT